MLEEVKVDVEERFYDFLKSFKTEDGRLKYPSFLEQAAVANLKSLVIDMEDLISFDDILARLVLEEPDKCLPSFERAALKALEKEAPEYRAEVRRFHVRLRGLPQKVNLREIGSDHIRKLIRLDGVVVRSSPVRPLLVEGAFQCRRCGQVTVLPQTGVYVLEPSRCSNPACRRTGPFELLESESTFINFQEIRIQEKPEDLPPGQIPRWLNVKLEEDLVDVARPGDHVSITGIVRTEQEVLARRGRLRTFNITIDGNYVEVLGKEPEAVEISPEEEEAIRKIAQDPWVHNNIILSIAPSIHGYEDIKEAIMYLLFGGVPVTTPDGVQIRGDINVLLIGDPGTGKSQLLQYVHRIAPRGLYTHGRGTTAAGLTLAVLREPRGGMTLEAGALVLSDRGVCAIDEIDKMRPEDRVAIHEAMEQQTCSVAKGGIVATLNARASILAAANPALGRYDPYRTVSENINLPVTILSRFDLIFVLRDQPSKDLDARVAEHVLTLHKTGAPPVEPVIPPELLKKYISYAKRINPVLTDEAKKRLQDFYLRMRAMSESADSPIAITIRQIESSIRLAEARARAALRSQVTAEDAEAVIRLMQKSLMQVGIDLTSGKLDIDLIMTGKPKSVREKLQVIIGVVTKLEKEKGLAEEETIYEVLKSEYGIDRGEAMKLLQQLKSDGTLYSPKLGFVARTR